MTFSQKVARFFEIVNYLMLIPAALGLYLSALFISGAAWFTLIVWGFAAIGMTLLVGYFKHSRGRLAEGKIKTLWIGTIVYNLVFLLPTILMVFYEIATDGVRFFRSFYEPTSLAMIGIVFWWTVSVIGSAIALKSNQSDQKFL